MNNVVGERIVPESKLSIQTPQFYHSFTAHSSLFAMSESTVDSATIYKIFPRQILAFEYYDSLDMKFKIDLRIKIFSFELKSSGKRKFLVASWKAFFRKWFEDDDADSRIRSHHGHFYEIIRESFPCRAYFDLEFSTIENPTANGDKLTALWIHLVAWKLFHLYGIAIDSSHVVVLDSTTDVKYSKHVIIRTPCPQSVSRIATTTNNTRPVENRTEIFFANNTVIDDLVRSILIDITCPVTVGIEDIRIPKNEYEMLWVNSGGADRKVFFVDLGVYSRNRAFRLFGCSKYGKNRTLKLLSSDKRYYHGLHAVTSAAKVVETGESTEKNSRNENGQSDVRSRRSMFEQMLLLSLVVPTDVCRYMCEEAATRNTLTIRGDDYTLLLTDYGALGVVTTDSLMRGLPLDVIHGDSVSLHRPIEATSINNYGVQRGDELKLQSQLHISVELSDFLLRLQEGANKYKYDMPILFPQTSLSSSQVNPTQIQIASSLPDSIQSNEYCMGYNTNSAGRSYGALSQRERERDWDDRVVVKSNPSSMQQSPFPALDKFVLDNCASRGGVAGRLSGWVVTAHKHNKVVQRSVTHIASSSLVQDFVAGDTEFGGLVAVQVSYKIRYQIAQNRYCLNVGRQHKSNGIMIDVDLNRGLASQTCWDPDCRGYRSPPVVVPAEVMPSLTVIQKIHAERELKRCLEVDPLLSF